MGVLILLILPSSLLLAGTYRPRDGLYAFLLLLGFLLLVLGILHLVDQIRSTLRKFRSELDFEDLF
jgi:hypothetical protein